MPIPRITRQGRGSGDVGHAGPSVGVRLAVGNRRPIGERLTSPANTPTIQKSPNRFVKSTGGGDSIRLEPRLAGRGSDGIAPSPVVSASRPMTGRLTGQPTGIGTPGSTHRDVPKPMSLGKSPDVISSSRRLTSTPAMTVSNPRPVTGRLAGMVAGSGTPGYSAGVPSGMGTMGGVFGIQAGTGSPGVIPTLQQSRRELGRLASPVKTGVGTTFPGHTPSVSRVQPPTSPPRAGEVKPMGSWMGDKAVKAISHKAFKHEI